MRWIAAITVLLTLLLMANAGTNSDQDYSRQFHSWVPLGGERIDLHPADRSLYLLTTAHSSSFDGMEAVFRGTHRVLLTAEGAPVRYFPSHLAFRFTATAMRPDMLLAQPYGTLNLAEDAINDYILGLGFRLKIFHGLDVTYVQPDSVRQIGMPADEPYNERVFNIEFTTPQRIPIEDRIVLEVLSPSGARICKFHLDLF